VSIEICDVGPRDGLQSHSVVLAPAVRAALCDRLVEAGVPKVEAVSFVRSDRVPPMAGAEEVLAGIRSDADPRTWSALVLNERGYERARTAGLLDVHFGVMVTESFSQRNCNASVAESVRAAENIIANAHSSGVHVAVTLGVAFGCPFEGPVEPAAVLRISEQLVAGGVDALMLADTIGCAMPREVATLVRLVGDLGLPVGAHLHNTRNAGYANALAAVEAGATVLEASIGGIGGCPFAPGATGNIATEDLVNLLHGQGIPTGINLDGLIDVARWLEGQLGEVLPGYLHNVGPFSPSAALGA
jgi:hydroxymethylglutaryl-CoA lyase/(R)-citramalyl-CoA lyase